MAFSARPNEKSHEQPKIWWSNGLFFVSIHVAAVIGVYYVPPWETKRANLLLWFITWQLADFGVTIGYHRLYSHRSFRASLSVRVVLALLGSAAFQGSIKWWCLRHRLHHRFTDDPVHDPYAATRGLFYSHIGWIFFKPRYGRIELIDRSDLERDPVVQLQHRFYVPLALALGFIFPASIGTLWGDVKGSFIWGGLVSRLCIWHCTFLVNSLAHWDGLQPYSDEDTSRGNLVLALLTGGEGNHNFHHSFPHDFRSGPSAFDWDPSKWIIWGLYKAGLVSSLQRARETDIQEAKAYIQNKASGKGEADKETEEQWTGKQWCVKDVQAALYSNPLDCLVLIDNFVVDVTAYLGEHPGGGALLRKYAMKSHKPEDWVKAGWAFNGGLNNHSRAARRRMRELVMAKFVSDE